LVKAITSWRAFRPILFELIFSIAVGVLIEIVILSFHPPLSIVRHIGDDTADRLIRLLELTTNRIPTSPAFVFIDIDDSTWTEWGSPLVTPRDDLAILLDHVVRSAPLAILLDVDLAYSDGTSGKALNDILENYKNEWPPLLLVRSLVGGPDDRLPTPRTTKYDEAVGPRVVNGQLFPAKENVMFTSPLFERDGDGKVRRWKLFAEACDGNAPIVVPSMHLAAAMIARHSITVPPPTAAEPPLKRMMRALAAFTPANCGGVNGEREGVLDPLPADRPIKVENDDVSKRVIYRVAWKPGAIALGPLVDRPGADGGGQTQLVAVRPARLVVQADPSAPLAGLDGRIVVIGGSFQSGGDRYNTPLGVMPGSLMIINAIEALTQSGTPREFSPPARIAISLTIILVASLLTSTLRPIVAAVGLSIFLLTLMLASLNKFQAGAVLDLAVPAVGAFVHDLFESTIRMGREIWQQGLSWVWKQPVNESGSERHPEAVATEDKDG
jgi:CHASE2 domain-containing sensor protein